MKKINKSEKKDYIIDKEVKIAGTKYDRRRVLSDVDIRRMKKLRDCGYSKSYIASIFGVSNITVAYHTEEKTKAYRNAVRATYGQYSDKGASRKSRIQYKRAILAGKVD